MSETETLTTRERAREASVRFDAARQVFLAALRVYLADRSVSITTRWQEVVGTVSVVRQLWHVAEHGDAG